MSYSAVAVAVVIIVLALIERFATMLRQLLVTLLITTVVGCQNSGPSAEQDRGQGPSTANRQSVPATRTFDAAAERELKEARGTSPKDKGESATGPHEGTRWRIKAEVVRLDAAEPGKFHQQTITVEPAGLARVYIRLRSPETKKEMYPGQKHEFEATFEKHIWEGGIDALVFKDGEVVGGTPANPTTGMP